MIIQTKEELIKYQQAAEISTAILAQLRQAIKVGVTALEIDSLADQLCQQHQVKANFKGVKSGKHVYQHATCISVNDVVVHGIPNDQPFQKTDLVKVDFGINHQGLNTDHCFTVAVEEINPADEKLVKISKKAVQKAAKKAITGNTTGDLGYTMQSIVEKAGLRVVKEFIGHGIGRTLHEKPAIPAFGKARTGQKLEKGMVLCVEAQVVAGNDQVYVEDDGWTVRTADGSKASMFEYMVVVQDRKPIYLTKTLDWPIIN